MPTAATLFIRLKLLVWALISFGIFAGISYYRHEHPQTDAWWYDPSRDLALGVFPLGLSILIWEFFLRKNRDKEIIENVEKALESRLNKLSKLEEDGIIDVAQSVSNTDLRKFMEKAKKNITVFVPFFVDPTVLESLLRQKLTHRNFVFQILLFAPDSLFLKQRSLTVFRDAQRGEQEVKKTLRMLSNVLDSRETRGKIEIRTFNSLPSIFIVRCDERAMIGFYMNSGTALEHPHIIVETGDKAGGSTTLGKMIEDEFDRVFSDDFSQEVTAAKLKSYLS